MHHRAKLTDEQVQTVRRLYSTGTLGYRILARAMKCSQWTVRDIVKNRTRPVQSSSTLRSSSATGMLLSRTSQNDADAV